MRFSIAATAAALVASAYAASNDSTVYVTDIVSTYTTYCPEATEVTHNGNTYTVTEPTTLVITDCPCTVTSASIVSSSSAGPATPSVAYATTAVPAVSVAPSYSNGTSSAAASVAPAVSPAKTSASIGTSVTVAASATTSGVTAYTGAAGKVGAGLAAVMGFAALAL